MLVRKRVVNTYSRAFPRQVFDKHHFLTPDTPIVEEFELPSHLLRDSTEESKLNSAKVPLRIDTEQEDLTVTGKFTSERRKDSIEYGGLEYDIESRHKQSMEQRDSMIHHKNRGEIQGSPLKRQKLQSHGRKQTKTKQRVKAGGKKKVRTRGTRETRVTKKAGGKKVPIMDYNDEVNPAMIHGKSSDVSCETKQMGTLEVGPSESMKELVPTQLQESQSDDQVGQSLPLKYYTTSPPAHNLDTISMEMTCETVGEASQGLSNTCWRNRDVSRSICVYTCSPY